MTKGPEAGYSFIIWANEPESFNDFYGDIQSEFDYRVLFDLEESEYKLFLNSSKKVSLSQNNAIISNMDGDDVKVRIYMNPTDKWFERFESRLGGDEQNSGEE